MFVMTTVRSTQRFVSGNICLEGLKSPEILGFNCSGNKRFRSRNITSDFRNKRTDYFLMFSEGQLYRFRVQNKVS